VAIVRSEIASLGAQMHPMDMYKDEGKIAENSMLAETSTSPTKVARQ
jgi:hypothetical protein